jgi:uncharacterized protein YbbC (DUF1343 family)
MRLPGVRFRPAYFQPTFQKWSGELCAGAQAHVTDRAAFRPVLTAAAVLCAARELWPGKFAWKRPPYEYEEIKLPIDILAGDGRLREAVDSGKDPHETARGWEGELESFASAVEGVMHYD